MYAAHSYYVFNAVLNANIYILFHVMIYKWAYKIYANENSKIARKTFCNVIIKQWNTIFSLTNHLLFHLYCNVTSEKIDDL